jgi:hypothetical protein
MNELGRYPLSVILSHLTETEGTTLMITRKQFAYVLLPQFRLFKTDCLEGLSVRGSKRRHRFIVSPVQDPSVLLDRLNTRRLYKRRSRILWHGLSTAETAAREWDTHRRRDFPPELGLLRFLDHNNELRQHAGTLLVSYPRSGNTLMRSLLERITGLVTGSDTRPDRNLSKELAEQHDLAGEGVTHPSRVIFVKTHWPERIGNQVYEGKRAVLIVRNPYDAIDSYWNLIATKSHTKTLADSVYDRFRDKWSRLVKNEIHVWMKFHNYWLEECKIPVLVVRFEDMIQAPNQQLERVLKFSLGSDDISSFWKAAIDHVTILSCSSTENLGSYRPRSSTQGAKSIGKSIQKGRYSNELLAYIHRTASEYPINFLQQFGYDVDDHGTCPVILPTIDVRPESWVRERHPSTVSVLQVNVGCPARPVDCEFGRAMQQWRYSVTNYDAHCLPTVT